MRETLPELIARFVRSWPQWSPAEREHLDEVTWEVIEYMSDAGGGWFAAWFCERHLIPWLRAQGRWDAATPENAGTRHPA